MVNEKGNAGYYADCYVLTNNRSKNFIYSFLNKFLPNREESDDEYEIPQYSSSPTKIFKSAKELIDYLEQNTKEVHTIYWSNKFDSDIQGGMCFFTNDGKIILGLYCKTLFPDTTIEDKYLKEMETFCESNNGYYCYEEPTTHDSNEFLKKVKHFRLNQVR